ncbi:MAG: hypothetical protein HOC56_16695 [Anaerolineae bacterium]|nr:hypothetical protein [Anaerolineae bacterium]
MNEPSVLDYLKSKLGMTKGEEILFPTEEVVEGAEVDISTPSIAQVEEGKLQDAPVSKLSNFPTFNFQPQNMPWRSLLALLFALFGQKGFEPPHNIDTFPVSGFVFYSLSFLMLALAYYKKEWQLPTLRKSVQQFDTLKISFSKILILLLGGFFGIAAFITFAGNQFNLLNTFPWVLSILFFVGALWRSGEKKEKNKSTFKWDATLLAVLGIILFFRLYQTGTVPPEPFSDHAEKILDVYDISEGNYGVFFPRNTGREALQMYWTLLVSKVFGTGLSFLTLKLGTALLGLLTLPYIYLLGQEIANKRVGLIAMFFMGISYWHNIISRVGLRFPLYPLFVAPVLFYLLRGIRRQSRNDFIIAGLFLGLGSHGYSPFRIMPLLVVAAILLYLLHKQSRGVRTQTLVHLFILALLSIIIFIPLGRYALSSPHVFSNRAFSRLGYFENDSLKIFASNLWDGIKMFNWDNGGIWVHSVGGRPALGVVSGAFFIIGLALLFMRYLKRRNWLDLYLILSILLLQLPSTLSIAFPEENPALNRAGGAAVVVFLVIGLAVDGLLSSLKSRSSRSWGGGYAWGGAILLVLISLFQNYNLVFNEYTDVYSHGAWNSSEMGLMIQEFEEENGQTDTVWIVPYEHWVDTRLPGVWAGIPNRNFGLWTADLYITRDREEPKLFIFNPEDMLALEELEDLYPEGVLTRYASKTPNHDFLIYRVP